MLNIADNQLTDLPNFLGQLSQLQDLYLYDNQLTTLPNSLSQLFQLERLSMGKNQLSAVPDCLGQLSQLKYLHLHNNRLTDVPDFLAEMRGLQELHLDQNRLTTIPASLGQLFLLQLLDLSNNQLATMPNSLGQLLQLQKLFLHGNDALGIPKEVLGPNFVDVVGRHEAPAKPSDILEYYFRTRSGSQPLNEAKLILVGHGNVGKTSLVNRLVFDTFDPNESETKGINITQWPILLHDSENVRLNTWDFGGQEIMHSTHRFFLTQRSLYLLVLDGRQGHEDADAEYWLTLIENLGADSPVIVVLNKIEDHPFDLNEGALRQKFPFIRRFIKTDCKDRTGIDALHQTIKEETDQLEHLRDRFPAAWVSIKERLAGMEENYLSFSEYREYRRICADLGEGESQAQESLSFALHSLGIALNYRGDPRLQDVNVLNPRWVTNGIYTILNAKHLAEQKGEMRIVDLRHILDQEQYPPDRHEFLLELMRKFDLCFSFPDTDGCYLIPDLLDKQQPEEAAKFDPKECLNFQYHYPVMHEGLLPRFIVRSHVLSDNQPRWRTGVIQGFEGNRALVKADIQDKKVYISVNGPLEGRRRLLAVIRSDFDTIHRSFTFDVDEMVPIPGSPNEVIPYDDLRVLEEQGRSEITMVVNRQVVDLNVGDLLNGVDLEGTRRTEREKQQDTDTLQLFYSYSHKDEALRNELETHLKLMQRNGLIAQWHDRRIIAGEEWNEEIANNLNRADIILLLVSADFIASDFCYEKEMGRAIERHDDGEAVVIPVIIRDVNWHSAQFSKLQALPTDGKAVTLWPNKDTAWRNVSEGIEKAVQELRRKKRR